MPQKPKPTNRPLVYAIPPPPGPLPATYTPTSPAAPPGYGDLLRVAPQFSRQRPFGLRVETVTVSKITGALVISGKTTRVDGSPATSGRRRTGTWRNVVLRPDQVVVIRRAVRLCDDCYTAATGLLAECQDGCDQDLDHLGLCLDLRAPQTCTKCGRATRLTEVEPEGEAR